MSSLNEVLINLELKDKDGLYFMNEERWETEITFPNRIKSVLKNKLKPTAFFLFR